ncbi:hypothetical protein BDF22DRAFT_746124 [Syncephalis plumigaleata]|nr:hypothetical protein BDF22DRAFT_746124 [Syncephalis plumigaleata]
MFRLRYLGSRLRWKLHQLFFGRGRMSNQRYLSTGRHSALGGPRQPYRQSATARAPYRRSTPFLSFLPHFGFGRRHHHRHSRHRRHRRGIMTDSMTSVAWWKQYVTEAVPWSRAKRRATPTYKIWELIADRVARREVSTEIEWARAHIGTVGNEMADREAKAAAITTNQMPRWTLNIASGKVHQYDLLASGLNTLLSPRQLIKKQSKARHARTLKQC